MFRHTALAASVLLAAWTQHVTAVDKTRDPELIARLITANSQLDRLALLPTDADWFFDFTQQQPFYTFAPGGVVNMNAATFPAAKGNGMTSELQGTPDRQKRKEGRKEVPQESQTKTDHKTPPPVAMLNLGPCSMLPPHYHPRAANYVVAIKGNTTTYMYEENGARLVTEQLLPMHATVFPQGALHMMMNTGE